MPTRLDLMHVSHHPVGHRRSDPPAAPPARWTGVSSAAHQPDELSEEFWDGPTLRELVDRVEHQFGQTPALAGVYMLGFGRDEPLTPGDIQAVCEHLGLPATDFGLDP